MCVGTCRGERSAAIQLRGIFAFGLFLLTLGSTATAKYSGGSGTAQDPYQIATAADLIALGETPADYDKHFILTADIDLDPKLPGRKVFDKAVIAPNSNTGFNGVFDGNGHTISHLTITGKEFLGLLGLVGSGGEVKNLGVVNVTITGSGHEVGGLVGSAGGTVTRCSSTNTVAGRYLVGGLMGQNSGNVTDCCSADVVNALSAVGGLVGGNSGSLTRCYSTGVVSGTGSWVGGLVGANDGRVTCCYSTGVVRGTGTGGSVGGLAGFNLGSVTQCFSTGPVSGSAPAGGLIGNNGGGLEELTGTVSNCLWDIQTSGRTESAGGTGKTTAEMQTAKTYIEAGWDFVGETANGVDDIWGILEGKDYPRFTWELLALSPVPVNGATDVIQSPILSWFAARIAVAHDVYFGEDKTAVANATPASLGIYRGRQPVETVTFDPGPLEWGRTCYWRVDEVNEANPSSPWKGSVWMFSLSDIPIVAVLDDIESYTDDEGNRIYQTWIDGLGPGGNVPANGTNSVVGNMNPPFAEQTIVHAGKQSMPMDYNNVKKPWYSEGERTWATPQDWTTDGADTLTLYFWGKADNGREPLYVAIEDSAGRIAVVVHPDAEAVLASEWQK